ncbi:hypothetical protein AB0G97_12135 [Streptomyces sp. NPDC020755]|uniref:hypothetical protein n=1 Tax=unclassified Streptomyces TaxID=2593676 RepID=UPI002242831C|nr:hypothetical protein [Streptomyces sp. VB1]UZI31408.1 hypothetical protein OH133_26780 [Streptomyces sp. VB1]
MAKLEPFLALASAVAEGRISAAEFSVVCLPLYKNYPGPFPSHEQYEVATELFYVANDHYAGDSDAPAGTLSDEQVRAAAAEIAERMRSLLQ